MKVISISSFIPKVNHNQSFKGLWGNQWSEKIEPSFNEDRDFPLNMDQFVTAKEYDAFHRYQRAYEDFQQHAQARTITHQLYHPFADETVEEILTATEDNSGDKYVQVGTSLDFTRAEYDAYMTKPDSLDSTVRKKIEELLYKLKHDYLI